MSVIQMLDGNGAAVEAIKLARVKVVSAYPITPQSSIAEKLSEICASGGLQADYIRVESEHSAMSCAVGAQLTGVRCATATASVGLALMHEVLNVASGCRVPLVMPVVNRSLASPWSLWCDHQDSMAERDSGWLQLYCENVQDVLDTMLMSYRIAEDMRVQLPAMVCLDGFFLSHSMQKTLVPTAEEADAFLGEYKPKNMRLDPARPLVIDNLTGSNEITEMKYQQAISFANANRVMEEVFEEFYRKFGRKKQTVESYCMEDAEYVLVCMGSMAGTAKYTVNRLRKEGIRAGLVKVVSFRPFPYEKLGAVLQGKKNIAVLDRTTGFGGQGTPLWVETKAVAESGALVKNYIAGIAGRDISIQTIERVFSDLRQGKALDTPVWIDCDTENAMEIREVPV